jgi:MFS transporter, DHA1 family, tetracycline resistance protein
MYQIGHDTLPSTWVWVTMAKFGWTERDIGLSLAVLGFGTIIVQGGLVGLFTQRIGEHRTALLGLTCGAVGFVGYAFATTPAMLFASVPLGCLIGLTMPALRAILSRATPANAQGELQGAIAGIVSFTAVVIPFTMTHLFSWATAAHPPFPGASFLAAAVALAVGAVVLARIRVPGRA